MDRFKWYSSYSDDFNNMCLGDTFLTNGKTFLEAINDEFSNEYGIRSYLYVYIQETNPGFRIYFSIDGTLYELRNLLSYTLDGIEVVNVKTGRIVRNNMTESLKEFVATVVIGQNMGNILSQVHLNKHVALVQIDFDDYIVSVDFVANKLREIFNEYFVKNFGEMR